MLDNALEQVLTQNGVNGAVGWLDALQSPAREPESKWECSSLPSDHSIREYELT